MPYISEYHGLLLFLQNYNTILYCSNDLPWISQGAAVIGAARFLTGYKDSIATFSDTLSKSLFTTPLAQSRTAVFAKLRRDTL